MTVPPVADGEERLLEQLLHDLRNPLGVIAYFAEVLPEAAEAERSEMCQRLRVNADRALHVLEEFSLLADLRHGHAGTAADEVDLTALIAELAAESAAERGAVRIQTTVDPPCTASADRQQWLRALRALFRELARTASGDLAVAGERAGGRLTLRVTVPLRVDAEIGIAGRLDTASLGFELVRRLAELYDGRLAVAQRPGNAVLRIVLPV